MRATRHRVAYYARVSWVLRALVLLAAVTPLFAATAFHPVWWQIFLAAAVGSALGQLAVRFARGRIAQLAVIGVAVAVIGVTVAWSLRRGAPAANAGYRYIAVRSAALTWDDVEAIRALPSVHVVVPYLRKSMQTASEDQNWNTSVIGTTPDYFELMGLELVRGSGFEPEARKIVVLGETPARQLFGAHTNPVGATMRINNLPFEVVGELAHRGTAAGGEDLDDVALIPAEIFLAKIDYGGKRLRGSIFLAPESEADIPRIEEDVRRLLRDRHLGADDDVTILTLAR